MRRAKIHSNIRKVDVVVTSARYEDSGGRLLQARGFERRGAVWSDTQLFDRQGLALQLRGGRRVVVGRETDLPGDYEIGHRLRLQGDDWIVAEGSGSGRDDLGVPLF